jgi:nucleoid-associated protein YgaU
VKASEQREKHKKFISALSIFAAVTAIGWASVGIFSGKSSSAGTEPAELSPEITVQNEARTPKDSELIASLYAENEILKSANTDLTGKLTAAPVKSEVKPSSSAASGTIIHTVRNGDTFWIIAKKYYHDGRKYKQIAMDNGLSLKTKLRKGQKIKIVTS